MPFETPAVDPEKHLSLERLVAELDGLPARPTEAGRVVLLVARGKEGARWAPSSVSVSPESGVWEDRWARSRESGEERWGKESYLEMQIAVMEAPVAELIANGQPWTLFGDNVFLDLDLSMENLPTGSRLRIGSATFEVTPYAHDGCRKFNARFGPAALRFVSEKSRRNRNLRGIYLRALDPGQITVGDKAERTS